MIRVSGSHGSKTYYFSVCQHECSCFWGFLSLNPLLWRKRSGTNIAGMCHMGLYICFCILSVPIIYPFFLRVKLPHPFRLTGTHPLHRLLRPFSAQKSTAKETDHFLRRVLMLIVLKGAQVSLSGSGIETAAKPWFNNSLTVIRFTAVSFIYRAIKDAGSALDNILRKGSAIRRAAGSAVYTGQSVLKPLNISHHPH